MSVVAAIAVPHPPLIVPAVGRGEESRIANTIAAYERAVRALLDCKPDVLVITSPHAPLFRDGFHVTTDPVLDGNMARFRAPQERIHAECDTDLAHEIIRRAKSAGILVGGSDSYRDDMDHGTYVPLYFVREAWHAEKPGTNADLPYPIVRIGLSGLSAATHAVFGRAIAEAANSLNRRVGFIASGDLSHKLLEEGPYGFAPEGPVFDEMIGKVFASGTLKGLFDFDESFCNAAAECGLRSFQIMSGAIEGLEYKSELLSNEGPFGVGYGVATCLPASAKAVDELIDTINEPGAIGGTGSIAEPGVVSQEAPTSQSGVDPCVALARLSVETFVRTGQRACLPEDVAQELLGQRAGAFVSLHEHGELRGCIGTISATTACVAEEILQNGVSACSQDPRFDPVRADELDYLEYSVDILGEAEPIDSTDDLDPKRYGVIVTKGWKRGLLLPNLEGVDSVSMQISIAKQKAGIRITDNDVKLERFEVVRHTRGGEPRK